MSALPNLEPETLEHLEAFAHKLADSSGDILRRYFRQSIPMDVKGDDSPVTLADKETERDLRLLIAKEYPHHGIVGEEEGEHNSDAEWLWVLDPIDGTRNFIAGKPLFTTLIGLCYHGTPMLGLIDQPITRERWVSIRGHVTKLNGEDVRPRPHCNDLADAIIGTTSPHLFSDSGYHAFERIRKLCRDVVYGSDAYAYALLASGFIDVIVEEGLQFHDVAPLIPVIEGEGGVITDWQGQQIDWQHPSGRVVAAANPSLHQQALIQLSEQ